MNQEQIETNDLFKGAYFLARCCRLKETKFIDNHQVRFILEGEQILEEDQRYHTGQGNVEPLRFKASLNYLRKLLTETLNTHNHGEKNDKERRTKTY